MTTWPAAPQTPLSMGFPRQEHWSGLPFPSPGDLLNTGIEPGSPALAGGFSLSLSHQGSPIEYDNIYLKFKNKNTMLSAVYGYIIHLQI